MRMILNKVLETLGAVLFVGMAAVVLWQAFPRTVLGNPSTIVRELVWFDLVWFAMLSSAYAVGQKTHLAVTVLSEKLTGKKSKILEVVVQSLFLVLAAMITVYGGQNVIVLTVGQISLSLNIPMGYVYLSVPVSEVLIVIYSLVNLVDTLSNEPAVQEKV